MENTNSGQIVDPFAAEQEKQKWMKKAEFAIVLILRGVVYLFKIILKIAVEVLKNILRTFKILPS